MTALQLARPADVHAFEAVAGPFLDATRADRERAVRAIHEEFHRAGS